MEVSKSDWKLFRQRIAGWQEGYMEKLNKEYIRILQGEGKSSDKFWELEKRVKKDKKHPGVLIELNKHNMVFDVVALIRDKAISVDDLEGFSEDFTDMVQFFLER
ncbi:multidrug transporter [Lachnospiraceae bacterium OttesenSCG-928-J05]|nr:multidrug transporter [Lachnospiraceae bacterium OttesenSCG-928-J05]